jgi:hypothetical protein
MGKQTFPLHWHNITPRGFSVMFTESGTHLVYAVNSAGKTPWWKEDDQWYSLPHFPPDLGRRTQTRSTSGVLVPDL